MGYCFVGPAQDFLLPVVIGHQNAIPETFEFVIRD
jgi:hypothetical protein